MAGARRGWAVAEMMLVEGSKLGREEGRRSRDRGQRGERRKGSVSGCVGVGGSALKAERTQISDSDRLGESSGSTALGPWSSH